MSVSKIFLNSLIFNCKELEKQKTNFIIERRETASKIDINETEIKKIIKMSMKKRHFKLLN